MATKPKKEYSGGHYCCVTECHHRLGREKCSFFNVLQKYESRTELWRQRIKRMERDGSLWMPSKWSKICGCHFQSGKPSPTNTNPDYAPSIFPTKHVKAKVEEDVMRFQRVSGGH